jgi:hypothetical protein
LPDLQEWIKFYGGYYNIPPAAWARWDRLYEAYREHRRINLGSPVIRAQKNDPSPLPGALVDRGASRAWF